MEDLLIFQQKLTQIFAEKGLNKNTFAKATNISSRQMTDYMRPVVYVENDGMIEEKGPSVPTFWVLRKILNTFPDISAEWLLRDRGDVVASNPSLAYGTNVNIDSNVASGTGSSVAVSDQTDLVTYLKAEISRLQEELSKKDKRINDLTDRLLDGR